MFRRSFLALCAAAPLLPELVRAQARLDPRYARLILRCGPDETLLPELAYEGNNVSMRGPRIDGDATPFAADGATTATAWRTAATSSRLLFVLRDTLFSQQDHPIDQRPHALLMPPSWISIAVDEARAGRAIRPMQVAPETDDRAWAVLDDATIAGSFIPSTRLGELARAPLSTADPHHRTRIANARTSLRSLAADVAAMTTTTDPSTIAAAGAARLAASDRAYFGDARPRISAIYVENANEHERVDEGKGFAPSDRTLDPESIAIARRAVLAARLADGDLSLERYDITREGERARLVAILTDLVPRGSQGATVWVWVHAGYDGHSTRGPDPLPHVARFRRELRRAPIARARVRILPRPSLELPRDATARRAALDDALARHEAADLPLSVHANTRTLLQLLA